MPEWPDSIDGASRNVHKVCFWHHVQIPFLNAWRVHEHAQLYFREQKMSGRHVDMRSDYLASRDPKVEVRTSLDQQDRQGTHAFLIIHILLFATLEVIFAKKFTVTNAYI